MISEDWRNELLSKINIADIVGEYVSLQNKGGRLWACCPFHHEKTPSFTVNTDRQYYHCFGCGKGGNAINFVMEAEKLSFPEACQFLADKVGMQMPQIRDKTDYEERKRKKQTIYAINKAAARFFHSELYQPGGKAALEYFMHQRGLTPDLIKTFGLGYAPDSWDALLHVLQKQGFQVQDIAQAGLCKLKDGKAYDIFRGRPIMPIIDVFSNVIGFGGRAMKPEDQPKYLNTAETLVFNKRKNLYNMNLVRKIHNLQYIILAEGYMDVIALYTYGFKNAVATLGTALTPEQARFLSRYTKKVIVSYDGDVAGRKATLRAVDILHEQGLSAYAVSIPEDKDPDEFLKEYGSKAYLELLKKALPRVGYKLYSEAKKCDLTTMDGKESYLKACIPILKAEESAIVRERYIRQLSQQTGFSERSIQSEIGHGQNTEPVQWDTTIKAHADKQEQSALKSEQYVMLRIIEQPQAVEMLREKMHITEDSFQNKTYGKIFFIINDCIKKGFSPTSAEILSRLSNEEELSEATALMEQSYETLAPGKKADTFLIDCIRDILRRNLSDRRDQCLKLREQTNDETKRKALLSEVKEINERLNSGKLY